MVLSPFDQLRGPITLPAVGRRHTYLSLAELLVNGIIQYLPESTIMFFGWYLRLLGYHFKNSTLLQGSAHGGRGWSGPTTISQTLTTMFSLIYF
jgi:hypothetical protein